MTQPIYMDHNATTPVDPRVLEEMLPYFTERFGNASSHHLTGTEAACAVDRARVEIQRLIGDVDCKGLLVFTSGASESNNLALRSGMHKLGGKYNAQLMISSVEHKCVIATARALHKSGVGQKTTAIPVNEDGIVKVDVIEKMMETHPSKECLVSVMAVNNETGVISPIKDVNDIVHGKKNRRHLLHVDAAQAIGKIPFDVVMLNPDMVSLSAHKFYGPKGVGALWLKDYRTIERPIILGGGQENGLRSGTLNVPGIVGMAAALRYAIQDRESEFKRLSKMRDRMQTVFMSMPEVKVNGLNAPRTANCLNISFRYAPAVTLISSINDVVSVSAGSACTSTSDEPSHVLKSMGLSEEELHSSIRISLGRSTTGHQVDQVTALIKREVERLRSESILWQVKEELDV